jgi:ABC-type branched-chain amino acid transport systems, periplasmic component
VKLGVLNDQTGLYADLTGMGSVHAARMAVEDYGGKVLGRPIEVIFADHQNKPDIGANIARQWIENRGRQRHPRHSQFGRGARRARGDAHARRR